MSENTAKAEQLQSQCARRSITTIIIATDIEDRPTGWFTDASAAALFAETDGDTMYARCYRATNGALEDGEPLFWKANLMLNTGSVACEQTGTYKSGSATNPCRDGFTIMGHVAHQETDYIVAWGASRDEAEARVMAQWTEGRRRAARDRVVDAIIAEARDQYKGMWDPYGWWMRSVSGLEQKIEQEGKRAYDSADSQQPKEELT